MCYPMKDPREQAAEAELDEFREEAREQFMDRFRALRQTLQAQRIEILNAQIREYRRVIHQQSLAVLEEESRRIQEPRREQDEVVVSNSEHTEITDSSLQTPDNGAPSRTISPSQMRTFQSALNQEQSIRVLGLVGTMSVPQMATFLTEDPEFGPIIRDLGLQLNQAEESDV